MEIRNNTPSFGMAFVKPKPEEMAEFTNYVTRNGKMSPRLVKKGLAQLVKKHAEDMYFDIYYKAPNQVYSITKNDYAQQWFNQNVLPYNNNAVIKDISHLADSKQNSGEKVALKRLYTSIKRRVMMELNPITALPKRLRIASQKISEMEQSIRAQVDKEIKAQNLRKTTQKMIDSVFDKNSKR